MSHFSERPLTISKTLRNQTVMEKEPVTFQCEMSKSNQPVQWLRDGKPIRHGAKYKISSEGPVYSLSIPKPSADDSGEYTVKIADVSSSAKLVVKGKHCYDFLNQKAK